MTDGRCDREERLRGLRESLRRRPRPPLAHRVGECPAVDIFVHQPRRFAVRKFRCAFDAFGQAGSGLLYLPGAKKEALSQIPVDGIEENLGIGNAILLYATGAL